MSANLYEVLALGMRYWFVLLGVMIVLRSFLWLRRDRHERHKRLRRLPDAGTVGELVVLEGSRELPEGAVIAVPWEGVLGFNRTCDIVVPVPGVAPRHLDFSFEEGRGLLLTLRHGQTCAVDDQPMTARTRATACPVLHGSVLRVGDAVLKLRVFEGINVAHFAQLAADDAPPQEQAMPQPYAPGPGAPLPGAYAPQWPAQQPWQQPAQQPYAPQGWQATPYPPPFAPAPPQAEQPFAAPQAAGTPVSQPGYGAYMPPAFEQPGYAPLPVTPAPQPEGEPCVPPVFDAQSFGELQPATDAQTPQDLTDADLPPLRPRHRRAGRRDADA